MDVLTQVVVFCHKDSADRKGFDLLVRKQLIAENQKNGSLVWFLSHKLETFLMTSFSKKKLVFFGGGAVQREANS